ncbi:GNAT family N-acetyltransferase [Methanolacinia paynteri]|uniref:GNAT family N-acetyltransferase n=1 Tax=Methanolacinia paynteri TaxID=230356 RepID=UPI00064E3207|nr:GNAT family N-acetyltransferase [Methanolacinia paynteri]
MMAEFLPTTKDDLAAIAGIYNHYILNSSVTFHGEEMTAKDLEEIIHIAHPKYASFTIKDGDDIIGFCYTMQYKKRQAYDRSAELSVYLKPGYTGKGIGDMALRHLEDAERDAGIRVLIGTLCSENRASTRLLEKAGYTKCAHLRHVGEKFGKVLDVIIYQKEI